MSPCLETSGMNWLMLTLLGLVFIVTDSSWVVQTETVQYRVREVAKHYQCRTQNLDIHCALPSSVQKQPVQLAETFVNI